MPRTGKEMVLWGEPNLEAQTCLTRKGQVCEISQMSVQRWKNLQLVNFLILSFRMTCKLI